MTGAGDLPAPVASVVPSEVIANPGLYATAGLAVLLWQHRERVLSVFGRIFGRGKRGGN
ncbi:MAG TPA: hypothetical protein VGE02_09440 [Gemmatimonadales bacterium]